MISVIAINKVTGEKIILGYCNTREEAQDDIDNNIEWDDFDIQEDWIFEIHEVEPNDEPENIDSDFGYDPYSGCYTYDC